MRHKTTFHRQRMARVKAGARGKGFPGHPLPDLPPPHLRDRAPDWALEELLHEILVREQDFLRAIQEYQRQAMTINPFPVRVIFL